MEIPLITYYSAVVATIGLIVSASLAIIKFKEYRRDSKEITVGSSWTGNRYDTDKIFLTNLSAIPVLISYWSLEWHECHFFRKPKITPIPIYDDEDLHITLDPRTRYTLEIKDQYRFSWSPKNNSALFIRLKVTGRKKNLLLKVV